MKFFDMLADFFMMPIDSIIQWFNDLQSALAIAWKNMWINAGIGITHFVINGVAIFVVSYAVYCACRIICTFNDEKFSEYLNKEMILAIAYTFVKFGGNIVLKYIGG